MVAITISAIIRDTSLCTWQCIDGVLMWLSSVCLQVVTVEPAGLSSNHAKKLRLLLVSAMVNA